MSYSSSYSDSSNYSDDDYSYTEEDSQDFALQAPMQTRSGFKRTSSEAGLIDRDPIKKRRIAPDSMEIDLENDVIMHDAMQTDPVFDLTRSFATLNLNK